MIQTINEYQFSDAFHKMGRGEQFSYEGLKALYDDLIIYEESSGDPIELDVISLCCDYSEYESLKEFQEDYGDDYESISEIGQATTVIMIDDTSFIIQNF
jgi:hypothetical protein